MPPPLTLSFQNKNKLIKQSKKGLKKESTGSVFCVYTLVGCNNFHFPPENIVITRPPEPMPTPYTEQLLYGDNVSS